MALPADVQEVLPLSPAQSGMLFHVLEGAQASGQYVAVLSCTLEGPLDVARLQAAMQKAVERRDAYRAAFIWDGVKTPLQAIKKEIVLPWELRDWTAAEPDTVQPRLDQLIADARQRSFDLKAPPLMAVTLIRLAATRHVLVWTVHHLISDGWSTSVVFDDILALYGSADANLPKAATFRDYLGWLRKQDTDAARAFWQDDLAGLEAPCALSVAPVETPASAVHGCVTTLLDAEVSDHLAALAKRLEVTHNTLLSTIWALVLRRWSMTDDVVFGQTSAARPPQIAGITQAAGAFINTLPFRLKIDPLERFSVLCRRAEALQRARAPYDFAALSEIQKTAGLPSGSALFDCVFAAQGRPARRLVGGDLQLRDLRTVQSSNYALTLVSTQGPRLQLELYHDPLRIDASMARACLEAYETAARALLAHPDQQVEQLEWMPADLPTYAPPPLSVVDRFCDVAAKTPDAVAVSDGAVSLSYAELQAKAVALASALKQAGVQPDDVVPVAVPRGVAAIISYLGVMMAGAAYVPLDLTYPKARIEQIIAAVRPRHIVTGREAVSTLPQHDALAVFWDGGAAADPTFAPVTNGAVAYVMFTSGSQGVPKGVEITHANLAHSTQARDSVYGSAPGAFLMLSSFAFDSSVAGIYWTICTGGHLVIAPTRAEQDVQALGRQIAQHGVTHALCLPSLYRALLDSAAAADLATLRIVIAAGEPLPPDLPDRHRATLPGARLFNEYGPTEATVWCSYFDATDHSADQPVPIGQAIPGLNCAVCDLDGAPLPAGLIGEIVVSGASVGRGYLGDTQEGPFGITRGGKERSYRTGDLGWVNAAGDIMFLGRKDAQIKIRGQRVEPAEIIAAAKVVDSTLQTAVVAVQHAAGTRLVLCVAGAENADVAARLHDIFARNLPAPAQPARIVFIEAFPLLPNGKTDQKALTKWAEALQGEKPNQELPQGDLECQLAEIWKEVLGVASVGRHENFFDLGGDSLKTITVFSKATRAGIALRPNDLFEHPTLHALAAHLVASSGQDVQSADMRKFIVANKGGKKVPVVLMHGNMALLRNVAAALGPDHRVALLFSEHLFGAQAPISERIEHLAQVAVAELEALDHPGPYALCGYSAACAIVLEMARLLGPARVASLSFIDPPYRVVAAKRMSLRPFGPFLYDLKTHALLAMRMGRHGVRIGFHMLAQGRVGSREWHRLGLVKSSYVFALGRYRVAPYDGPVQILMTPRNPALQAGGVWDRALATYTIEAIPFEHHDLLYDDAASLALSTRLVRKIRSL